MDDLELKAIGGAVEIKDAEKGEVTAVVSVFNVVDRDGDVILPGAIRDGTVVKLSGYGHDMVTKGLPPAGRGTIRIDGNRAFLDGRYFMGTQRGRESFEAVKETASDSEWSIGFPKRVQTAPMTDEWRAKGAKRLIAGMTVIEASPVLLGANQYTSTVTVKSAEDQADGAGETAPDPPPPESAAPNEEEVKAAQQAAEMKAAQELAALAALNAQVADEFQRFQRTLRQHRVA